MKGFSLTEMLIALSLGLLMMTLLFKVYEIQLGLHHKIEDMVFLDHHGVLAMKILKNEYGEGEFKVKNRGLWYKKSGAPDFQEVVSGVESLSFDKDSMTITVRAPQGAYATFSEKIPEGTSL
jgi:prepilin-type N-terminal cleavage/methylation domain-containing protein